MPPIVMELDGLRNQYKKDWKIILVRGAYSITDPNIMEGDGKPNLIMFNGLQSFGFDFILPIS